MYQNAFQVYVAHERREREKLRHGVRHVEWKEGYVLLQP